MSSISALKFFGSGVYLVVQVALHIYKPRLLLFPNYTRSRHKMTDTTPKQENWWDAFPAPRAKCEEVTSEELMKMFDDMDIKPEPKSFLVVDVRRDDWQVRYLVFCTLSSDIDLHREEPSRRQ